MSLQCRSCSVSTLAMLAIALSACSDPDRSALTSIEFDEVPIAEEETLKDVVEEIGGTCPAGYELLLTKTPGEKPDLNGNGYVCWDGKNLIDDEVAVEGAETEFAGGHGNFVDFGKKVDQNVSFSFHGRQNKSMIVKGEFELHDFNNDLRIHGDVNCLIVAKNTATLGGIVTQSTDRGLPVGTFVMWQTVDNGEGINAPVDLITRPLAVGSKEGCKGKPPAQKLILIDGGNIQVLQ